MLGSADDGYADGMTEQRSAPPVPDSHRDLLEQPLIAHLATIRPDGGPQTNPVWFEWDGEHVKLSQTRARQKARNMEQHPRVALSITDPEDPYRYLEVRGEVVRIDDDPDRSFIDHLAERYMGQRPYPYHQPEDERIVVHVRPTDSSSMAT